MTYLEFYEQCMESGFMEDIGLCNALPHALNNQVFDMVKPTLTDFCELDGKGLSSLFWASGLNSFDPNRYTLFTPLRQTLVLLMAAIAGEFDN